MREYFLWMLDILKRNALPAAMVSGALIYTVIHIFPVFNPIKPALHEIAQDLMPILIFLMLFITFCRVDPRQMRFCAWHGFLLIVQLAVSAVVALAAWLENGSSMGLLLQGLLVCLICPTATAAPVICAKLGGNETSITTYAILSNVVAAASIPAVFALVSSRSASLLSDFVVILARVFPLLIAPFFLAWLVRLTMKRLHHFLLTRCREGAFYLWALSLILVTGEMLRSLMNSPYPWSVRLGLAIMGLFACLLQFALGKWIGTPFHERINAGQGLGQKNTMFGMWAALTYLSPETALGPGAYILWQNSFNAWQLYRHQKARAGTPIFRNVSQK